MKVVVFPADDGACGLYRIRYPAAAMQKLGYDVTVSETNSPVMGGTAKRRPGDRPDWDIQSGSVPDADVVVLQRPAAVRAPAIVRYLKQQGIRVVIELDDDFKALTSRNFAWHAYRDGSIDGQTVAAMMRSITMADRLVVSTPALGAAYSTDVVMPNCVPESYLTDGPPSDRKLIGWTGTLAVHQGDLSVVGHGVRDALAAAPEWRFSIVGDGRGVGRELSLGEDPESTGWLPTEEYLPAVQNFGIGIAPLADTAFNRAKSWLKALEYGALGVPCVTSALPEYETLGIGEQVRKPRQWKAALTKMMSDEGLRAEHIRNGRKIASEWTYEKTAKEWWDAWTG